MLGGITLIHVRHGQTDWNAEGRLQGQQDIPLNPTGRGQAARNGRALAAYFEQHRIDPEDLDWIASPLSRSRETMEIIRDTLHLDPTDYRIEPTVREVTFGTWEGFTLDEIKERDPAGAAARKADKWGFVPPGGESYALLSTRVGGWLKTVEHDTVLVSHGGVQRVLEGLLRGVAPADQPNLPVPQDKVFRYGDDGASWF